MMINDNVREDRFRIQGNSLVPHQPRKVETGEDLIKNREDLDSFRGAVSMLETFHDVCDKLVAVDNTSTQRFDRKNHWWSGKEQMVPTQSVNYDAAPDKGRVVTEQAITPDSDHSLRPHQPGWSGKSYAAKEFVYSPEEWRKGDSPNLLPEGVQTLRGTEFGSGVRYVSDRISSRPVPYLARVTSLNYTGTKSSSEVLEITSTDATHVKEERLTIDRENGEVYYFAEKRER